MGLVGVLMRQVHRVDVIDIGVDQLLAQIGRGVDHDSCGAVGAGALELSTATDNEGAQRLYESEGWVRDTAFYVYGFGL